MWLSDSVTLALRVISFLSCLAGRSKSTGQGHILYNWTHSAFTETSFLLKFPQSNKFPQWQCGHIVLEWSYNFKHPQNKNNESNKKRRKKWCTLSSFGSLVLSTNKNVQSTQMSTFSFFSQQEMILNILKFRVIQCPPFKKRNLQVDCAYSQHSYQCLNPWTSRLPVVLPKGQFSFI